MGRLVSTLAMVLVLAGLAGYIYFLGDSSTSTETTKEKAFGTVASDLIEEVRIALNEEKPARATKTGDAWKLVEPAAADADATELSSITSSLATLDIERVVDEKPSDLAQYGLAPARIDVSFKMKGQAAEKRILLGDKTPRAATSTRSCPTRRVCSWSRPTSSPRSRRIRSRCATRPF